MFTATPREIPEDMRMPDGLRETDDLWAVLEAIRRDIHRYRTVNYPRTQREYGQHSMSPLVYRAGLQKLHTAWHTIYRVYAGSFPLSAHQPLETKESL